MLKLAYLTYLLRIIQPIEFKMFVNLFGRTITCFSIRGVKALNAESPAERD